MEPYFEKLLTSSGESYRCFNRQELRSPVKWHHHPEVELTFLEAGSGSRLVGDHIGSYTDNDLVLLGSGLPHTWSSDEYRGKKYDLHPAIVVQFLPSFLGERFFAAPELSAISALLERAEMGVWYRSTTAQQVGKRMTAMTELTGVSKLIELFQCLHELSLAKDYELLASESYSPVSNVHSDERIRTVCDHIERHLADAELDQKTIAALVDMNPSAFSRFFQQSTGRTVTAHIAELRVGLACRLLTNSDESILNISLESGFSNLSNFNRRFREQRGMTPSVYRKQCRSAL